MDAQKADMFIMSNGKFFESHQIPQIRERLLNLDDNKWLMIQSVPLKDPQTALIISIFLGTYGIDRFYIGKAKAFDTATHAQIIAVQK